MQKGSKVDLPPELFHYRSTVEQYVEGRIQEFAIPFGHKLNPGVPIEQLLQLASDTLNLLKLSHLPPTPTHNLRLVLKHDCESSGCGDNDCELCKFNPNRLCKRNLKQKYLIDDNLKAKCNANVRVEINDEQGRIYAHDLILEVNVLSWDKYKEVSSQCQLLSVSQLRSCFVQNTQKSLLRREGNKDHEEQRVVLQLERGSANLSELQVTTSSEALLSGKAPGFMLLIWAVDVRGEPLSGIQYVVSEKFVVTTKRVKQAIKSDIPSVDQHVSKLVHVGRATVDKLNDLRQAALEEQIDIDLPEDLCCVEKVGQFQKLVEIADLNSDFKQKLLKLLKLSPEKWEELSQHALAAVVPDFQPRLWCSEHNVGLLFMCKHGAAVLDHPVALIQVNTDQHIEDKVVPIQQLEPNVRDMVTQLRRQAKAAWYQPSHPHWGRYWKTSQTIQQLLQGANQADPLPDLAEAATPTMSSARPTQTANAPSPVSQSTSPFSPPSTSHNMTPTLPMPTLRPPSPPNPPSPMNKSNSGSPLGVSSQLPALFPDAPPLFAQDPPSSSHGLNPSALGLNSQLNASQLNSQLNSHLNAQLNPTQLGLTAPQLRPNSQLNPSQLGVGHTPLNTSQLAGNSGPHLSPLYHPESPISSSNAKPGGLSSAAAAAAAGRPPPAKRQQPPGMSPFSQDNMALVLAQQHRQHWDTNGGRPSLPSGGMGGPRPQNTRSPFASNALQQQMFTSIAPVGGPPRYGGPGPPRNDNAESFALQLASGVSSVKMPSGAPSIPPGQLVEAPPSLEMLSTEELRLMAAEPGIMNWALGSSAAIPTLSTIFNSSGMGSGLQMPPNSTYENVHRMPQANDHSYQGMINPSLVNDNLSLKLSMSLDLANDNPNTQDGQNKAY